MTRRLLPFAESILVTAISLAVVLVLHPVLDSASYVVLVTAIAIVSALWGLSAAFVAMVVAILAIDFMFVQPTGSFVVLAQVDAILLLVLGVASLIVAVISEAFRRRLARAEADGVRAAALADFFARASNEAEREVDALHSLRTSRDRQ